MCDKIKVPGQGSVYDKVFKENMQENLPGLIEHVLNINVKTIEELKDDIQYTKERKTDLIKKVTDEHGMVYILHIEYQTDNYKFMHYRMAEYSIMLQRKHQLPVSQFVIYIGPGVPNMPTTIHTKDHKFRYNMTALSTVDYRLFLKSNKIEEKMLAVLGNLDQQNIETVLEQILRDIELQDITELEEGRYLRQLRVLLQLRNLNKESINNMALTGKIFKEEKDILFIRGEMKGERNGELKRAQKMALEFKKMGYAIVDIAKGTGLSIQEVEAIQ